jgi:hypothetical protein
MSASFKPKCIKQNDLKSWENPIGMEQRTLKNVNNYLNTNIYSYLETYGGQSSDLCVNIAHLFNTEIN